MALRTASSLPWVVFAALFLATCGSVASAQTRDLPPPPRLPATPPSPQIGVRDRPPVPQVGTGVLAGRVVDAVTGRAIARARVRLMGPLQKGPILSDQSGGFEFDALPRGGYSVVVDKATYLSARFPDAGRSVRNRGSQFDLADGQRADDIRVAMFRGGVIAGRVLDMYGEPVDNVSVMLVSVPKSGRPQTRGGTQANDLGEFRIARVEPGRYLVRARAQGNFQPPTSTQNDKPLPQPLPVYYPGVVSADQAQLIVVNRGETVSGIDFMLTEGIPTTVSGVVISSDGQPVKAGSISVRSPTPTEYGMDGGTGIRPDGTFRLQIPPGDYMFEARGQPPGGVVPPERAEIDLVGMVRVSVAGESVEGIVIPLGNGATASGRVIFEGTTPPPAIPRANTRVPLYNPEGPGPGCRSGFVTVEPDWTFKAEGLGGTCAAQPGGAFGRWLLKAVTVGDQNLMDKTVTFESGQHYANMRVVVTDKRVYADFTVIDEAGQPSREFVLIVFPADKDKWNQLSRYARIVSMSRGGRTTALLPPTQVSAANVGRPPMPRDNVVRVPSLAPGDHYAVAVDDIDPEDVNDAAVMEKLTQVSVRFTASDDAPMEVPLRRVVLADIIR